MCFIRFVVGINKIANMRTVASVSLSLILSREQEQC